jgi:hypothetical protein
MVHAHRGAAVLLALAALAGGGKALATTVIYVNHAANGANDGSSWADAFVDLQDALAAAAQMPPGDAQIWVAAGTYRPGPPDAPPEATFNLVSGVALYGGFAGDEESLDERDWVKNETILSGKLADEGWPYIRRVLKGADLAAGTALDGFTIRDGYAPGPESENPGGGLRLANSTLRIANCVLTKNGADFIGGAIWAVDSHVELNSCRVLDHVVMDLGAAIYAQGGQWEINACEFRGNRTAGTGYGGALWGQNITLHVTNTLFDDNRGGNAGAGGAAWLSGSTSAFHGCTFIGNHAYGAGAIGAWGGSLTLSGCFATGNGYGSVIEGRGALHVADCTFVDNNGAGVLWLNYSVPNPATFERCVFVGNDGGGPDGASAGGVVFNGGQIAIRDCTFDANVSWLHGNLRLTSANATLVNTQLSGGACPTGVGGLFFSGGSLDMTNCVVSANTAGVRINADGDEALFTNCTVINNSGPAVGAGIRVADGAQAIVRNSILWGNCDGTEQAQIAGGSIAVEHSCIQGLDVHSGLGNIGADPLFADGFGRLSPGSPAIDAGSNDLVPPEVKTDLDGNPRIIDGNGDGKAIVDMGAFEFRIAGDLNADGVVDQFDLLMLLAAWGECPPPPDDCDADLNGDGVVDVLDLLVLLGNWT